MEQVDAPWRWLAHGVFAVLLAAAAVLVRLALDPWLDNALPLVTLFGAVAAAVWMGGIGPAVLTAVLGYVACAYWFIQPRGHLLWDDTIDLVGMGAYLVTCTIIIAFGEALRRARRRATENGERLHTTLRSIGDGVLITDVDGCVVSLNAVAEHLTGWSTSEAEGRPVAEVFRIVNDATRETVASPVTRALREEMVVGLANHTILIARDGAEHPIDDSAAPIRDGRNRVTGCVMVFRDVGERRAARHALRRSEHELADFFDTASIGLHWAGPDGIILRANQAELDLLGYTEHEYIGRHVSEFHVDQPVISDILERLNRGERLREHPARLRRKDGTILEVMIDSSVLFEDGHFIHTRCFTRDVTRQRQAERAQAQLAAIVASSGDAIVSKTLDGIVVSWNAAAERLFGYSAVETIGKSIELIIPPERHHEEQTILARLRAGDLVDHFETVRVTKGGRLVNVSLTISPVRDASGRIIGASKVARDITERKAREHELVEADRRKDEFLATLAHEIRNPLAPLSAMLAVMKRAGGDPAVMENARATMERQTANLVRLVDDLVDVSRISRNKLDLRRERLELSAVLQQAVETCQPLIAELGHELALHLPAEPVYLDADPVRLVQVFNNLLNNACKYTKPEGRISLSVRCAGQVVEVQITDSGVGIPADHLPMIFGMFIQVTPQRESAQGGLGIGLTIVKQLVEMHGGTVTAASEGPGLGSTFTVRLPTAISNVAIAGAQQQVVGTMPAASILVVDDNADASASLTALIELWGAQARTAADGLQAVTTAESFRPDVVLLDIGLPKLNGYDVARRIRAAPWGKDMMLIALTGWGTAEDQRRSREAGFDAHMVKPVDFDRLVELVSSRLQK